MIFDKKTEDEGSLSENQKSYCHFQVQHDLFVSDLKCFKGEESRVSGILVAKVEEMRNKVREFIKIRREGATLAFLYSEVF
mmetsp:Transcript_38991/g.76638  ORF Transcript_38991/g.76638 Transcript_38991/m.76638 type:complete len:81 (+) Transcript_38991:744-986(+)